MIAAIYRERCPDRKPEISIEALNSCIPRSLCGEGAWFIEDAMSMLKAGLDYRPAFIVRVR
jgi:hypothetical protein